MTTFILTLFPFILLVLVLVLRRYGNRSIPTTESLNMSNWSRVNKEAVASGGFLLDGDALNYANGRPYKLHLKMGADGKNVWYAEFTDNEEWYQTDISW